MQEADSGVKVKDSIREHGISEQTYYNLKSKYNGMQVDEARRLKELESENTKLKHLVADKELQLLGLKAALGKNTNTSAAPGSRRGD